MAVTQQPQIGMTTMVPTGVPQGLEYLVSTEKLFVKQRMAMAEMLTGNKYDIFNVHGQQMFYCFEESDDMQRVACGPQRGFVFHVQDNNRTEVLTLIREFKYCAGVCTQCADGCCAYPIQIYDGQRNRMGMMRTTNSHCSPRFGIFDPSDQQLYKITGVCCGCQDCCHTKDLNFPIFSMKDDACVGNVTKKWVGALTESISDASKLCLTFPLDMHVSHKALLFASVFLLDLMMFENK